MYFRDNIINIKYTVRDQLLVYKAAIITNPFTLKTKLQNWLK